MGSDVGAGSAGCAAGEICGQACQADSGEGCSSTE